MVQLTPEKALSRLAAQCSRGEQAECDLRARLSRWGIAKDDADGIIERLRCDGFLDDGRYARAFVRDKFRFNAWGRIKIAHALRQKQFAPELIAEAMEEIDSQAYAETLERMLAVKWRSVALREREAARASVLRFAAARGFEPELIYRLIDQAGELSADS